MAWPEQAAMVESPLTCANVSPFNVLCMYSHVCAACMYRACMFVLDVDVKVWMCTIVHVRTCTYIDICVPCVYVFIYAYIHAHMNTCICAYMQWQTGGGGRSCSDETDLPSALTFRVA